MRNYRKKIQNILLVLFLFFVACFVAKDALARNRAFVYDWYIKNFETTITVNKNSSLDIVERITADCGDAIGKHGIFRVLPMEIKIKNGETIKTPIKLISITNFSGKPYKYKTSYKNNVIIWRIGNPKVEVHGVHNYLIHYQVGNVINFRNPSFDELYWNILGTFWDLEIDNFHARIIFPKEIKKGNTRMEYYTGYLGSKRKDLANYSWTAQNVLEFYSIHPLKKRQGITVSIIFPKGIFVPYHTSFWEKHKFEIFWGLAFLFPLIFIIIVLIAWWKYGRELRIKKPIIPIYKIPENLTPLEAGILIRRNKKIKKKFITAEIISLAIKGLITIKETEKKRFWLFRSKDYWLIRNSRPEIEENLNRAQKTLLKIIFPGRKKTRISSLKKRFYKRFIDDIEGQTTDLLLAKGLLKENNIKSCFLGNAIKFFIISGLLFLIVFDYIVDYMGIINNKKSAIYFKISANEIWFTWSILPFAYFSIFNGNYRTLKGAEVRWKIRGFKLFMTTVDKDRAKFYEKENIFEKFLPYAIVFGITDLWVKRIKEIYGEDYFDNYMSNWLMSGYVGGFSSSINSLSSAIDSISSAVGSVSSRGDSSGSGFGGVGGVGEGLGGGGGSGW